MEHVVHLVPGPELAVALLAPTVAARTLTDVGDVTRVRGPKPFRVLDRHRIRGRVVA